MRKFAAILSILIAVGILCHVISEFVDSNTKISELVSEGSRKASEELKVTIAEIELSNARKEAELARLQGKHPKKDAVNLAEARLVAHRDAAGYPSSRVEFEQADNLRNAQSVLWLYGIASAAFLVAGISLYPKRRPISTVTASA